MTTSKRAGTTLGALMLASILFGILSSVPALEHPGYLGRLPAIETQVLIAVVCQAAMAMAYVAITAVTYPLVRRHDANLAAGYLGLRMIGSGFLFVGIGSLLLLLWLSQNASAAGLEPATLHLTGELLRRGRDILNHIGMILPWSVGGLILYASFHRTNVVPRWLSVWGLAGSTLTLLATVLLMVDAIAMAKPAYFVMNAPTGLLEVTLAIFLMVKGFRTSTASLGPDRVVVG